MQETIIEFIVQNKDNKQKVIDFIQNYQVQETFLKYDPKFLRNFIQIDNENYDGELIIHLLNDTFIENIKAKYHNYVQYIFSNIFTFSDKAIELFKNEEICKLILQKYNGYLPSFSDEDLVKIFNIAFENNLEVTTLLTHEIITPAVLDKLNIPENYIMIMLDKLSVECKKFIIKKYTIHIENYDLKIIRKLSKLNTTLPIYILYNPDFIKGIITIENSNSYLNIIENLEKNNNIFHIKNKRKEFLEDKITKYSSSSDETISRIKETYKKSKTEGIAMLEKLLAENHIFFDVDKSNFNLLCNLFENHMMSNYIMEYLFEDYFKNIHLDIGELISYQKYGKITLDKESIKIYEKLFKIDDLSKGEKLKLFLKLKDQNLMEKLYDDIRKAKDISYEQLIDKALTKESIQKYKNEQLSNEYGVDVYLFDGQEFHGFIKCGKQKKRENPQGFSYSYVGTYNSRSFHDPEDEETFVYDGIKKEQIVHVFPNDSFTFFKPFDKSIIDSDEATDRVNVIMTPDQLNGSNDSYSEVLLLEKGTTKSAYNKFAPKPRKIAVYAINKITQEDIKLAKKHKVGIMLVKTQKYEDKKLPNDYLEYRKTNKQGNFEVYDNNYYHFSEYNEDEDEIERIEKKLK